VEERERDRERERERERERREGRIVVGGLRERIPLGPLSRAKPRR